MRLHQTRSGHSLVFFNRFSTQQDPCQSDMNTSNESTATKPIDVSDEKNITTIDLDASFTSNSTDAHDDKSPAKHDRTTIDRCHNVNNNAKFDGAPMLEIVSVTSLQPDDPLLESESKIVISDDEL